MKLSLIITSLLFSLNISAQSFEECESLECLIENNIKTITIKGYNKNRKKPSGTVFISFNKADSLMITEYKFRGGILKKGYYQIDSVKLVPDEPMSYFKIKKDSLGRTVEVVSPGGYINYTYYDTSSYVKTSVSETKNSFYRYITTYNFNGSISLSVYSYSRWDLDGIPHECETISVDLRGAGYDFFNFRSTILTNESGLITSIKFYNKKNKVDYTDTFTYTFYE